MYKKIIYALTLFFIIFILGITILLINDNKIDENKVENTENLENQTIIQTTEIPKLSVEDEQVLEFQEVNLENEGFKQQGEIAYNGSTEIPKVSLGNYNGLTYYSQADNRWANKMYSVINDKSQTMMTSGCGPTCAAMVVSSIKGTITPDKMGELFVKYGYRSNNNGTYFSAMKWTADVFDIEYEQTYSLDTAINLLKNNYYIIVSCNEGLFTYGGHFIVIVGIENNTFKIYDPYLYLNKFNVSSRKGKATLKGNTVYVTIDNFRKYANYTQFFCYKNDRTNIIDSSIDITESEDSNSIVEKVNYKVKINANSGLNIRSGASTNYKIIGGYIKDTEVTIINKKDNWGKTNLGWICLDYVDEIQTKKYEKGKYEVNTEVLTVRNGPGTNYNYKKYSELTTNAQKQILQNYGMKINGLCKGIKCDVLEVKNNWGKIPSGWICLDYCKKIKK